jgi:uncharacterized RDD family membrane protein YckC
MSERPGGGLTPGDPLGGEAPARQDGLWSGSQQGYTTPAPPGAGGPAPQFGAGPAGLPGRPQLASWISRVAALIIDGIIIGAGAALLIGLLAALGLSVDTTGGAVAFFATALLGVAAITIVAFLYAPLMMSRTDGQTVGRMVLNIRVIRADGRRMTFGFAFIREVLIKSLLFGVLSSITFGLASLLDVLWPLWDEENRALHDFVVNTRVIKA